MTRKAKPTAVELRLAEGETLVRSVVSDALGDETWRYGISGKVARRDVCRRLLERGQIVGCGDGLFPGTDQTYQATP